jgi:Ala-tRNA(Pro) deacylase
MVDFDKLKALTGAGEVSLVAEEELGQLFPGYELGAEPPFGGLYGMEVYLDKFLDRDSEVVFNAGTHTDMIKMSFEDYKRLVQATVEADFVRHI